MALNIKNADVEQLARDLADETGESLTDAVRTALRERLEQVRRSTGRARVIREVRQIQKSIAALPILDGRTADAILYDDLGLPG